MEVIDIENIKIDSKYLRIDSDVDSLCKSILAVGLINPITINHKNQLLAGGRRYAAYKKLGLKKIPFYRVDRSTLEQELISIDENIVRSPLEKIELENCLNRGREIFESLNPQVHKINLRPEGLLSPSDKKELKDREESDQDSFAVVTALKTGMSKSSIKSAIRRDQLAATPIKEARGQGIINAGQTNQMIRLEKNQQAELLPYIKGHSVKEVKKLVEVAMKDGVKNAIVASAQIETMPREFKNIHLLSKKMNKILSQIILEEITYEGEGKSYIIDEMTSLYEKIQHVIELKSEYLPMIQDKKYLHQETNHPNQ